MSNLPTFTRLYRVTGTRPGLFGGVVSDTEPTPLRLTWTGVLVTEEDGILSRARPVWRRR